MTNDEPMTPAELSAAFDKLIKTDHADWIAMASNYEQNLKTYTKKAVDQMPEEQIHFEEDDF